MIGQPKLPETPQTAVRLIQTGGFFHFFAPPAVWILLYILFRQTGKITAKTGEKNNHDQTYCFPREFGVSLALGTESLATSRTITALSYPIQKVLS